MRIELLNLEKFEECVKTIRNSYRAVDSLDETMTELKTKESELNQDIQKALNEGDLDAVSKKTSELKRVRAKLTEGIADKREDGEKAMFEMIYLLESTHQAEQKEAA